VVILDTSAWLAWTSLPTRLSAKATRAILEEEKKRALLVSAMSIWEVGAKVAAGKLVLDRDVRRWIPFATAYPGITVVPVDPADALESTLLPGDFHKDPVDRLLIALARRLDCPIITPDKAMRAYRHVKTIW
jgi:PIN domain nuclease of toxin-antitoxin system